MRLDFRLRAIALLLLLPAPVMAQDAAPPLRAPSWDGPPLSLAEAVRAALGQNASLAASRATVAPLAERPAQERALMPPRIEGQIWQWPVTTLNPSKVDMYMFMIEQEFPGRGKRDARAAAALAEVAMAAAGVDARQLEIAGDVRRTYAALALARRDMVAAHETGRALEQLVEAAHTTYAAGGGSQAAVLKTMLEVGRIEERLAMLAGDERMRTVRLNTLMGRDPGAPIGPLDPPPAREGDLGLERRVQAAVDAHPEVRAARAAIEQADRALAVSHQERKPDWMVQGGYMLMPGEAGAWTARVGLTWPNAPWARTRLAGAIAEGEKRRSAAEAALAAAEASVRQMLHEAATRVDAATRRLAVLRTTLVPQARHLAEATQVSFEHAQGSIAEALEARQVLLEAELDEARAIAELEAAHADLDAASGDQWMAPWLPAPPGASPSAPSTSSTRGAPAAAGTAVPAPGEN